MIDFNELYDFLRRHYRHSRFEGRNGSVWGEDYSQRITQSCMDELIGRGQSLISWHDEASGRGITFDVDLNILNGDDAPAERTTSKGHLTHLFG